MDNLLFGYQDYLTGVGTDIARKLDTGSLHNDNISWNEWLKKYNYENSPYTKYNYAVKIANNFQQGGKTKNTNKIKKNTKKRNNKLVKKNTKKLVKKNTNIKVKILKRNNKLVKKNTNKIVKK